MRYFVYLFSTIGRIYSNTLISEEINMFLSSINSKQNIYKFSLCASWVGKEKWRKNQSKSFEGEK